MRIILLISLCYQIATASIVNITRENFRQEIENSAQPWLINFCSSRNRECKNVLSEFLKATKILEPYIKLGFVDVDNEAILTYTFDATNVPRILLFGYDKSRPKDFEGFKTVRGFSTAALKMIEEDINEQIKSRYVYQKTVQELDEYSLKKMLSSHHKLKDWCVVNYSSDCHDCMKFSDIFKRIAEYFQHTFDFGAIDVLKHSHDLEKYPQVMRYVSEDSEVKYSGELTYDNLKQWLMDSLPDPYIVQLTSRKALEKTCQHKKYCVLVSMPSLEKFNTTHRINVLDELKQRAINSKQLSIGWLWFEIGEQMHLKRLLNIADEISFPIYTVVHVKKLIYLQRKQYNKENSDILDKMLGHVMDESDFNGIIEANEFPKIFKVSLWKKDFDKKDKIKTEL